MQKPLVAIFFLTAYICQAMNTSQFTPILNGSDSLTFSAEFQSINNSENTASDIDAYALFFNEKGYLVDSSSVATPHSGDHSAFHSGDVQNNGIESISLHLGKVNKNTQSIALLVTDAKKKGFNGLQKLQLTLNNNDKNALITSSKPGFHFQKENYKSYCFVVLERAQNKIDWRFYNTHEFGLGKNLYTIVDEAYRSILQFKDIKIIAEGMTYTMQNPSTVYMEKSRKVYIPVLKSNKIYFTGGWDINSKKAKEDDVDLDINIHGFLKDVPARFLKKSHIKTVYFDNKTYHDIINLDKDNRNGSDEENSTFGFGKNIFSKKDDEKIEIDLMKLEKENKIDHLFATVTVFDDGAKNKNLGFRCIKNPFVRLMDESGNQIAYFDLSALCSKKTKTHKKSKTGKKKSSSKNRNIFAYIAFEIMRDEYGWYYQLLDTPITAKEGVIATDINRRLIKYQKRREEKIINVAQPL